MYFKAGRLDEAVVALDRVPAPGHVAATLAVVNGLAAKGEQREALLILRGAMGRSTDAQTNFPLQSRMIELLAPDSDRATVAREIRRLRQMAAGEPELLASYFDLIEREAPRLKIEAEFRRELAETWEEGRGALLGGVALMDWQLDHGEAAPAAATWTQLLARPELDEPTVERALVIFRAAKDAVRETEALARLARLDAATPDRLVELARAHEQQGRHDSALKILDELSARAVFQDDVAARAARACVELGAPDRARGLFAQAVAADPAARNVDVHFDYARLLMDRKEWNLSRTVLRRTFRNPAAHDVDLLVRWFAASGRIEQANAELPSFGLTPQLLVVARRALFGEMEKSGRIALAVKLLDEQPEIFETAMCARLRAAAKTAGVFAEAAALIERIIAQSPLEGAEPANELALLLVDWADAEPGDPALARLKRAFDLRPDLWDAAERLSRLSAESGDVKLAAKTLRTFIDATKNAGEKEKAKQNLDRLPAS